MRTRARIALTFLLLAVATAIGVVAYQAGLAAGPTSAAVDGGVEVVRVVGPGWGGGAGFFPGFLFFPLFVVGFFVLARFLVWGGRGWGGPPGRHHDWERRADDWHRRQHDAGTTPDDGRDPAGRRPDRPTDRPGSWPDAGSRGTD